MAVCFKCKQSQGVFRSRDGATKPYCADCFVEFCTRQIRDNLFKHCGMPCEVPLAVAVSGGHSSMSIFHQLGVLRAQNRMRPECGQVTFTFIPFHLREDELVLPLLAEEAEENAGVDPRQEELRCVAASMTEQFEKLETMIRTQCTQWKFASTLLFAEGEVCVVRYSDYLSPGELQAFRGVLHHSRLSLSDRELLYERLRQRVLMAAALECIHRWHRTRQAPSAVGWYHLLTGENALRCCMTTLREVMSGNGQNTVHLSGYRGFVGQCLVLRPLRTMLPHELVMYCRTQGIHAAYSPSLSTQTSLRSMNRTLELFFNNMLRTYRTSVFNVLNTVNKLHVETAPELTCMDPQRGASQQQAKRAIIGKSAQHHYEKLLTIQPPHYSWFGGSGMEPFSPRNDDRTHQLCLLCACLIPVPDEHAVMPQTGRRQFICKACMTFLQGLPDDFITVVPSELNTRNNRTGEKWARRITELSDIGSLDAFSSLAARMEALMRTADATAETGREKDIVETRSVRWRLSGHDVSGFLLQEDGEDDNVGE
ncbi:hypothetical protein TCDM_06875 [Trypanosoma cruzi Dm28c]|uniref:Cytoplasmic tRNA 2-thiolation protein 2 n=1 Tax=Trypanosoma cruzi Dm28c TaxID=1416333 RepID=V5DBN7_TRYCR|nr:hypothetical protein TCDM_06875 [Trypanosoma cruzi Dm28c]